MDPFNWTCPHCHCSAVVSEHNYQSSISEVLLRFGPHCGSRCFLILEVVDCPNTLCDKSTVTLGINNGAYKGIQFELSLRRLSSNPFVMNWTLIPPSNAKSFPSYVPQGIRDDYTEACLIRELSPKASATLSRRCLQGMIRDFHQISKQRLVDEIEALRGVVTADIWDAIDALRKIGNIGAHMESNVNTIIDVDPNEASALIGLIELLIDEWYVARQRRADSLKTIVSIAEAKRAAKTAPSRNTPKMTEPPTR